MQLIQIPFWELLPLVFGLLAAFVTSTWAMGKIVLKGMDDKFRGQARRFDELSSEIQKVESANHENEKELLRLRANLPNEYVRREDWIRFSNVIDSKLDRLNEKIDIALGVPHVK